MVPAVVVLTALSLTILVLTRACVLALGFDGYSHGWLVSDSSVVLRAQRGIYEGVLEASIETAKA